MAHLSILLSGGPGNADPRKSLGGAMSTNPINGKTLFGTPSKDELRTGSITYRVIYVKNPTNVTGKNLVAYFTANMFGVYSMGVLQPANEYVPQITNGLTAPQGVKFSMPNRGATGVSIGELAPAGYRALYLCREMPEDSFVEMLNWQIEVAELV